MKAVAVVGPSDAGKTTLIERLLGRLEGRVATVKSIHHDVAVDTPGKDTYRHREAGAASVTGVTPSFAFTVESCGKGDDEATALDRILEARQREGFDCVLIEGFAAADVPTIRVGDGDRPVEGSIVARVDTGGEADLGPLLEAIRSSDDYAPVP